MGKYGVVVLLIGCLAACLFVVGAADSNAGKAEFSRATIDIGIVVSDLEKSVRFYKEALGFAEAGGFDVSREMAGDSGLTDYQPFSVKVFALGEEPTATKVKIMSFPEAPGKKVDNQFISSSLGYSYLTIFVADMTRAVERLKRHGVTLDKEPYRLGGGTYLALVKDPDGNILELLGPKP